MTQTTHGKRPAVRVETPQESPGSPERDHTRPPVRLDPGESRLPEGAQPTRDISRASWIAIAAIIFVGMAAVVGVGLALFGPVSLPVTGALTIVMVFFGLWPVLGAAKLRESDEQRLNEEDAESRAP